MDFSLAACLCGVLLVLLDLGPPAALQSVTGPEQNQVDPPDFMLSIYRSVSSAETLGLNTSLLRSSRPADTISSFVDRGRGMCTSVHVHVSYFMLLQTEIIRRTCWSCWVSPGPEDLCGPEDRDGLKSNWVF